MSKQALQIFPDRIQIVAVLVIQFLSAAKARIYLRNAKALKRFELHTMVGQQIGNRTRQTILHQMILPDDQAAGFFSLAAPDDDLEGTVRELRAIYLLPDWWGRGIGGAAKAGVLIKGADVFSPYMHATTSCSVCFGACAKLRSAPQ